MCKVERAMCHNNILLIIFKMSRTIVLSGANSSSINQDIGDIKLKQYVRSKAAVAATKGNDSEFKGVMYYTDPRFKVITKEPIGDYHFYVSEYNKRYIVMSLDNDLAVQLKKIADQCQLALCKIQPDAQDVTPFFSKDSLFLKISNDLQFDNMPPHRQLRVCVDVYGYSVHDKKAFLQCEVTEWKLESVL